MKNKKVTSLLVAGALTVGIVGGTLAWLTASDSVTNKFKTSEEKVNVDIYEKFDTTQALALKPGDTVDKKVQIMNSATFDQFIRVKLTIDGELKDYAAMNFVNTAGDNPSWVLGDDGYYYYMGKVEAGKFTNQLLDTVTFPGYAKEDAMNKDFNILVETDSVQASNGAYKDIFGNAGEKVLTKLAGFEGEAAVGDEKIDGAVKVTDKTEQE